MRGEGFEVRGNSAQKRGSGELLAFRRQAVRFRGFLHIRPKKRNLWLIVPFSHFQFHRITKKAFNRSDVRPRREKVATAFKE
jgi:hypothetical protein